MRCGLLPRPHRSWCACVGAALALAWIGCAEDEPAASPAPAEQGPGRAAPDFTLPDLQGKPIRLSDFRGKVVLIDFWATWCPPCVFQVPELNKFVAAHREKGDVVVIGVSVDVAGPAVVTPWAEEHAVGYTIVCSNEEFAAEFEVFGFPSLVIVDPEGQIDSLHVGLIEYDALEGLVAGLTSAG